MIFDLSSWTLLKTTSENNVTVTKGMNLQRIGTPVLNCVGLTATQCSLPAQLQTADRQRQGVLLTPAHFSPAQFQFGSFSPLVRFVCAGVNTVITLEFGPKQSHKDPLEEGRGGGGAISNKLWSSSLVVGTGYRTSIQTNYQMYSASFSQITPLARWNLHSGVEWSIQINNWRPSSYIYFVPAPDIWPISRLDLLTRLVLMHFDSLLYMKRNWTKQKAPCLETPPKSAVDGSMNYWCENVQASEQRVFSQLKRYF